MQHGRGNACLSTATAARALAIHQPVQELGVFRHAPIVPLALSDVRVQTLDRFHVRWLKAGDLRETLDFFSGQSNVVSEADHRRSISTCCCTDDFRAISRPCLYLLLDFLKKCPVVFSVSPQCDGTHTCCCQRQFCVGIANITPKSPDFSAA